MIIILTTKKPVAESATGLYLYGGEIGIRTLGTGEGTTDFESSEISNIFNRLPKNKFRASILQPPL